MRFFVLILTCLVFASNSYCFEWEEISVKMPSQTNGDINAFYKKGDKIYFGNRGIVKSTDGGKTFTEINRLIESDGNEVDLADLDKEIVDIYGTDEGTLFARIYNNEIIVSTDDGNSWEYTDLPNENIDLYTFVEIGNMIFASKLPNYPSPGQLYKSVNNGKNWQKIEFSNYDLHFLLKIYKTKDNRLLLFGNSMKSANYVMVLLV